MISLLSASLAILVAAPESWYGPVTISLPITATGNPYDAQTNDYSVVFSGPAGSLTRLAYFDGSGWKATLLAPLPGNYSAKIYKSEKPLDLKPTRVSVSAPMTRPFIRVQGNKFVKSDGGHFWPVGHNLSWVNNGQPSMPVQLTTMHNNGLNWARIWSCNWDGKNPYWPASGTAPTGGNMNQSAYSIWNNVTTGAQSAGVYFQWVLFHHGAWSSTVDSNWSTNPWNTANGGFLANPTAFFTNATAKRYAKNFLRYVVARYGHMPNIMAWELFNEVEWTDPARANDWATVAAWHDEMGAYLRSIDPYHRLVVTSSKVEQPIWSQMHYYNPHGYPSDVAAMVLASNPTTNKPYFYGEVGLGGGTPTAATETKVVRDALWSSLFAGHAGAAQYWYWDRVLAYSLYPQFARFTGFVSTHQLDQGARPQVSTTTALCRSTGASNFTPGLGWGATTKFSYSLPTDLGNGALGNLSSFIQGSGNRNLMPNPITFTFTSAQAGGFRMTVDTIARAGARVVMKLNGTTVVNQNFGATGGDHAINQTFTVNFPAGTHTVTVDNTGADWYTVSQFSVDGIGLAIKSTGASIDGGRHLARLVRQTSVNENYDLRLPGAINGSFTLFELNLDNGQQTNRTVTATNGTISGEVLANQESVLYLVPIQSRPGGGAPRKPGR